MKELKELIYKLETDLLKPEFRTSVEKLNELIANDFIEYGSAGLVYDKKVILERLPQGNSPTYTLSDFKIIVLSEEIIQTRFKTDRVNLDGTKTMSLRTSLWRNTNGNWQMFFHQGTPITK
ncbi:MAG: DUF4440 domain-containing protein [Patescibacteria group bacterium]|nr:DUF4440 domain-containing protein [Patescibacteria group bacterium]